MKTHRNILFLSFFTCLISLLFVVTLPQSTKGFQIALAFVGSSFISFLLEIPNFISLKRENYNRLYYSLHDIKANAFILNTNINNTFNSNIVTDKVDEQIIQNLSMCINNLRCFDPNYYFFKKKNAILFGAINSICNAFNNVKQSSLNYTVKYYNKRIDNNLLEGKDRNVKPEEMTDELNNILENSEFLIKNVNTHASIIFSKYQYKLWQLDDSNIINTNNNYKITRK